jgi:hypothetical protein
MDKEQDSDGAESESWMDLVVRGLGSVFVGSEPTNHPNAEARTVKRSKRKILKEMRYKIS